GLAVATWFYFDALKAKNEAIAQTVIAKKAQTDAEENLKKFNEQKVKELMQQIKVYDDAGQSYFICETYREVLKYEPTNKAALEYLQKNKCEK
ncbi:MAG: hypothetical protein ACKVTZ_20555, partial [Bacteroidia bacterium]